MHNIAISNSNVAFYRKKYYRWNNANLDDTLIIHNLRITPQICNPELYLFVVI